MAELHQDYIGLRIKTTANETDSVSQMSHIGNCIRLSAEDHREIARLTGVHYGPVCTQERRSEAYKPVYTGDTGEGDDWQDYPPNDPAPVFGYRYRHPYVSREASGAVPVQPVPIEW
jgi:hypothetical protein